MPCLPDHQLRAFLSTGSTHQQTLLRTLSSSTLADKHAETPYPCLQGCSMKMLCLSLACAFAYLIQSSRTAIQQQLCDSAHSALH
jgi:hypothetical protein